MLLYLAIVLLKWSVAISFLIYGYSEYKNPGEWEYIYPEWTQKMFPGGKDVTICVSGIAKMVLGAFLASGFFLTFATSMILLWTLIDLPFSFRSDWRLGFSDAYFAVTLIVLLILLYV